ncbi:ATP synthase F1 subunit delta [Caldicellulosiruptor changbaiensis]|uniref:ATP synthase subunit delta n=1 Tax=Caldicellulosiruptor changbaiensis TaxID=1222016 RepID=A0A3T0D5T3_9FIRM|nr:ATP synthase F1 subunit delta [Caldicellulosiruptor changbaiensis]AZT90282.1 ATP synthase F1 subunit delta [Caldicellulosiruptor changbaiensis]
MLPAKRYAEGLIKLAQEEGKLEKFFVDLFKIYDLFKTNREFVDLLFDLEMKVSDKKEKIKQFLDESIDRYIVNLIYLLIDKRREILLPYIPFYYKEMYDKAIGNVDVEVIVAEEVDEDVLRKISNWLLKRYDVKNPRFKVKVDRSIIGGIKLLFNNIEVDATIKGALDSIKKELIQNAI